MARSREGCSLFYRLKLAHFPPSHMRDFQLLARLVRVRKGSSRVPLCTRFCLAFLAHMGFRCETKTTKIEIGKQKRFGTAIASWRLLSDSATLRSCTSPQKKTSQGVTEPVGVSNPSTVQVLSSGMGGVDASMLTVAGKNLVQPPLVENM